MRYYIITYGCQMNKSNSEWLAAVLEKIGYSPTPKKEKADLIIINVCSVRQSAIDRVYGLILNIKNKKPKTQIKNQKIILTGCLLEKDRKNLQDKVDLIFDIKDLNKLPKLLGIRNWKLEIGEYLDIRPKYSTFPIAYVPIMTGCNNLCAYCVVPYTRGREISRPLGKIICEVKELIKRKYKMIVLLGQNVNSYQGKIKNQKSPKQSLRDATGQAKIKMINQKLKSEQSLKIITFPELLKMINDIPGDFWLTFVASHPKDLSDELIETMAKCEKVMPYLHLPVQSGDNQILKKMNRHYTVSHYKKLIKKIREKFALIRNKFEKDICISTDIIVGFPGETRRQFANTIKLMREIKFDMAYLAKYSPRPGTAAAKLKDDVPQKEKERRWKILAGILEKTALEKNKKYLGRITEVLIKNKKNGYYFGQTKTFKNVKVKLTTDNEQLTTDNSQKMIGKIFKLKIVKTMAFGLMAEEI